MADQRPARQCWYFPALSLLSICMHVLNCLNYVRLRKGGRRLLELTGFAAAVCIDMLSTDTRIFSQHGGTGTQAGPFQDLVSLSILRWDGCLRQHFWCHPVQTWCRLACTSI
jgi:hypothetical protein